MDNFNVPKKVNRHVLKALNILSGGNFKEGITMGRIFHQVKYQMRNLVPVPYVEEVIQKSLKNLSEIGIIEKNGTRFCMGRNYSAAPPATSSQGPPDKKIFRNIDKQRSKSSLNPNLKRNCCSDDSISGDDFDKTRKRMRSNNKQLKYTGRTTLLPRARQHKCSLSSSFDIDAPGFGRDSNSKQKNIETIDDNTKSTGIEFILATVTPTPSLEISETVEEIQKTKGDKNIGEEKAEITSVCSEKSQTEVNTPDINETVCENSKEQDDISSSDIACRKSIQNGSDNAENSSKQNEKVLESTATDKNKATTSYIN